jgi:hypothetical protein
MSFLRWVAVLGLVATFSAVFARDAAAAEPVGPVVTQAGNSLGTGVLANRLTDRPATKKRWYGWQPLAIDVSAFATLGTTVYLARDDRDLARIILVGYAATGAYALGAPITHLAHGQYARAGLSLGLRIATPTLAGLAASAITPERCTNEGGYEWCRKSDKPATVAVALGLLAAMAIDDAVLSWEPVKEQAGLSFSPTLAWDGKRGASAGVSGTF